MQICYGHQSEVAGGTHESGPSMEFKGLFHKLTGDFLDLLKSSKLLSETVLFSFASSKMLDRGCVGSRTSRIKGDELIRLLKNRSRWGSTWNKLALG
ncbi:hypothetical protein TNCV_2521721 [Trichonephila clavipes]|nr:hypothetical protein TNCV_2521721 [Trichonephila clavipes]